MFLKILSHRSLTDFRGFCDLPTLGGGGRRNTQQANGGGFGENFLKYKSKLKSFKAILRHKNKCSYYRPILLLYENVGETLCG